MSSTLLRLSLWTLVMVLVLYVIHESYEDTAAAEYFPISIIQKMLIGGVILLIAGLVTRVLERGAKAITANRCRVCKTPIAKGSFYCRQHLRAAIFDEDDRTRNVRVRR